MRDPKDFRHLIQIVEGDVVPFQPKVKEPQVTHHDDGTATTPFSLQDLVNDAPVPVDDMRVISPLGEGIVVYVGFNDYRAVEFSLFQVKRILGLKVGESIVLDALADNRNKAVGDPDRYVRVSREPKALRLRLTHFRVGADQTKTVVESGADYDIPIAEFISIAQQAIKEQQDAIMPLDVMKTRAKQSGYDAHEDENGKWYLTLNGQRTDGLTFRSEEFAWRFAYRSGKNSLTEAFEEYPGLLHYTDWSDFRTKLEGAVRSGASSPNDFLEAVGMDPYRFYTVIEDAVVNWRNSTSTSILQAIGHLDTRFPTPGEQIFPNLLWQTRFLKMAPRGEFNIRTQRIENPNFSWNGDAKKEPRFIKVTWDAEALTTSNVEEINTLLQYLFLYNFMNRHIKPSKKLPKVIYRGIRSADIFNHEVFKPAWDRARTLHGKDYPAVRKAVLDEVFQYIYEHGLREITEAPILSFTSSLPVAKYFTRGEGFILCLPTASVKIVSSEIHDPDHLAGGSEETRGKDEKEYIVRIPDDLKITAENIIVYDRDYYFTTNSPLVVELLDHNDKEAQYELGGVKIVASWQWNSSGVGGKLVFAANGDWWPNSRSEFKKKFGFDPIPNEKNLNEVKDFQIVMRKNYW